MSHKRYRIDLAFPEPLSSTLKTKLKTLDNAIRAVKKASVKINKGKDNEENTTTATTHICKHTEGEKCEPSVDI